MLEKNGIQENSSNIIRVEQKMKTQIFIIFFALADIINSIYSIPNNKKPLQNRTQILRTAFRWNKN